MLEPCNCGCLYKKNWGEQTLRLLIKPWLLETPRWSSHYCHTCLNSGKSGTCKVGVIKCSISMDELVQLQKSSQQGAINIGPLVIPQNVFLRKVVLGCCFSYKDCFLIHLFVLYWPHCHIIYPVCPSLILLLLAFVLTVFNFLFDSRFSISGISIYSAKHFGSMFWKLKHYYYY